jgi:hypothetical protein
MTLGVIDRVAVRAVRPDRDFRHMGARGLCAFAVRGQVGDRDALQLGDLAERGRSPEVRSGGTQHDHAAVVEQQFAVSHRPVVLEIAYPLGEAERRDQPVHRGSCVCVQEVGNDLRILAVVRHDRHGIPGREPWRLASFIGLVRAMAREIAVT